MTSALNLLPAASARQAPGPPASNEATQKALSGFPDWGHQQPVYPNDTGYPNES